ncbi:EamA family transporter [Sneathiella sp. P13V-1]|uniref:DMT family transporter n=1 Tax=Sneathiella sp. P13V-1 TaxID=2697366 RepID=UPI00187B3A48|nr:DMT family transporter [Sneathiella sp. P13V-1]MBE7636586.1 EamA family transporter [Sneathiella sp. P13V-1]
MSIFLYALTVVIWGLTWFAISLQLGPVPVEQSIAYRFGLASIVLFAALLVMRKNLVLPSRAHLRLLGQGLCLFSLNFICFYFATDKIPSGLVSVVFSLATILNVINNRLFFKTPVSAKAVFGGMMGLFGLALLVLPTVDQSGDLQEVAIGLLLAFCGTYCFSLGNMIGKWNAANNVDTATGNAFGMLYGTLVLVGFSSFMGQPFTIDLSPTYLGALVYLAIPGSVIGFTAYLTLVGRIGPEKAAYATVLFPVIALMVSSFFEGYNWTPAAIAGLVIVMMGNVIVFSPAGMFGSMWRRSAV